MALCCWVIQGGVAAPSEQVEERCVPSASPPRAKFYLVGAEILGVLQLTLLGEETFDNYEGCLSVPNLRGVVPRACEVRVQAWDRHGKPLDYVARGITAGTYQHEVDHLDGLLFLDRVRDTKTITTWADFDRFHKEAFVARVGTIVAKYGS